MGLSEQPVIVKPSFRLDDDVHKAFYTDARGEREFVRATTAFTATGIVDPTWFTQEGRERGIYLHRAVEAWFHGSALTMPPDYKPYWHGFLRFMEDEDMNILRCEEPVYDATPGYEYGGRFDLFGILPRKQQAIRGLMYDMVDVKTGSLPNTVKMQTAAYARCQPEYPHIRRWALVLPGNESYKLVPLNIDSRTQTADRIDYMRNKIHEGDFLAIVRVANLLRGKAHGLSTY